MKLKRRMARPKHWAGHGRALRENRSNAAWLAQNIGRGTVVPSGKTAQTPHSALTLYSLNHRIGAGIGRLVAQGQMNVRRFPVRQQAVQQAGGAIVENDVRLA